MIQNVLNLQHKTILETAKHQFWLAAVHAIMYGLANTTYEIWNESMNQKQKKYQLKSILSGCSTRTRVRPRQLESRGQIKIRFNTSENGLNRNSRYHCTIKLCMYTVTWIKTVSSSRGNKVKFLKQLNWKKTWTLIQMNQWYKTVQPDNKL